MGSPILNSPDDRSSDENEPQPQPQPNLNSSKLSSAFMTYDEHQYESSLPPLDATTPANDSPPKNKPKPGKKQTGLEKYMETCEDKLK